MKHGSLDQAVQDVGAADEDEVQRKRVAAQEVGRLTQRRTRSETRTKKKTRKEARQKRLFGKRKEDAKRSTEETTRGEGGGGGEWMGEGGDG